MMRMDPRLSQGVLVLAAAVAVSASWEQGYQALARQSATHRTDISRLSARLAEAEALVSGAGGQAAWLAQEQAHLTALKAKFPSQHQLPQLLDQLVNAIKTEEEMRLLNVSQGNLEAVVVGEQPLLIDGIPCYRLTVTVTAESRYHLLLKALARLTDEAFPCLVTLGQVELRRKEAASGRLQAVIQLRLHVRGTPAAPSNA